MPAGANPPRQPTTVPTVDGPTVDGPTADGPRARTTKVFLHVGMPKCASTTLQQFFARNDESHRALGFCYPRAFREVAGYRSHLPLCNTPVSELQGAVAALADEGANNGCDRVLLSCEAFAESLLTDSRVATVVELLNSRFGAENVTCIFLIRNSFQFAESVYSQYIRGGMFDVPDSVIVGRPNSGITEFSDAFAALYGFEVFEYSGYYELLRSFAPDNRIEVASVEPVDIQGLDIVDVLCRCLRLPNEVADRRRANRRLPGKALLALRHARCGYPFQHFAQRRSTLLQAFAGVGDGVSSLLHLSPQLTERVRRASQRDAAFLAGVLGSVPQGAFRVPAGFPRSFDHEMSLTDVELDAIRYVMEDPEPTLPTARRIRRADPSPSAR